MNRNKNRPGIAKPNSKLTDIVSETLQEPLLVHCLPMRLHVLLPTRSVVTLRAFEASRVEMLSLDVSLQHPFARKQPVVGTAFEVASIGSVVFVFTKEETVRNEFRFDEGFTTRYRPTNIFFLDPGRDRQGLLDPEGKLLAPSA